jgi:two-component system, LytTR family, response regulator
MITALVVDDEPRAVARLAAMLEASGEVEVIGTAANVDDAERFLVGRFPDVVFLDIDMPRRLGIDLVASLPAGTQLVFVTAHEGHAIDAFRHGALDYVLKPFDEERLAVTIGRLAKTVNEPEARPEPEAAPEAAGLATDAATVRLVFDGGREVELVPLAEVAWIEAVQNYTRVQAVGRKPGILRRTMQEWNELLEPAGEFHRLSRSLIIRLPSLRSTQWKSRYQTLLFFEGVAEPLPIGRAAVGRLRELLDGR